MTKWKETEIGKIPEDWIVIRLDELVTFQRGHDLPINERKEGKYPVIASNGIIGYHNEFKARGPGVTIGRSGNLGEPFFITEDYWPHNTTLYSLEFHNSDPKFVYYFLKTMNLKQYNAGSAVPTLNRNHIHSIKVPTPPLPEQRAIAKILSDLDAKIDLNRQMNVTLEKIAEALFKHWFVDFEFPNEQGKSYKSSGGKMIESELGQIPEGWRVVEIPQVCKVIDCLHSKKPEQSTNGSILLQFYNVGDLGLLDISETYCVSTEDYKNWTRNIEVSAGDCIITNAGKAGAVAQIPDGMAFGIGRNVTAIRPEKVPPSFLIQYLLSIRGRDEIRNKTDQGTIFETLNVKGILKLRLLIPSNALLEKYEKITIRIRKKMEVCIKENQRLINIRDSLLPILMSGIIRVPI